ncbi:MAG: hypothetical protein IPO67_01315 [Deltaproteobacteria bacterium]|nr:hypothetical protein [Deltaproteobacteria bacterium]
MLLPLLILGCRAEADYAQVQRDCETEIRLWEPDRSAWDTVDQVDKRCARTLGDSIGMEWEVFGFEPDDLTQSDVGAFVLLSLLTLVASDEATLGEALDDPNLSGLAKARLEEIASVEGLSDQSPAAQAWFELVHAEILSATYQENIQGTAQAAYDRDTKRAFSSLTLGWGGSLYQADPLATGAAILLHEASHAFVPEHGACTTWPSWENCDPDHEGAYGVELWWLHAWRVTYLSSISASECQTIKNFMVGHCYHIDTAGDWFPCMDSCP